MKKTTLLYVERRPQRVRHVALAGALVFSMLSVHHALCAAEPEQPKAPDKEALEFVTTKVHPLLEARCFKCHGPDVKKPKGLLRLNSRAAMLKGGESGPAIVPGDPGESALIDAINYGEFEMPPKTKLPEGEIAILTKWVKMGAPWPADKDVLSPVSEKPFPLAERKASHWSWSSLGNPSPPAATKADWPLGPIDQFIMARLDEKKLAPAPTANRRTLIRRAHLDLTGLPPAPDEVKAFVDDPDPTPQAFARVVDRLLESPRYGERWARHWLDLARYGESRGHESDYAAPNSYHYRDYLIRALNADVPYDQFVAEHIAGDLLGKPRLHSEEGFNESVLATGFWFLGEWVHSPVLIRQDETDRYDNMIDTMSRTFMGLTLGCARCHDHKFDAIRAADYYAMVGYLQSSSYRQARFDSTAQNRKVAGQLAELRQAETAKIRAVVAPNLAAVCDRMADYLMAAREVIAAGAAVGDVAKQKSLDETRLNAWVEQTKAALADANHPLHVWAKVAASKDADDSAKLVAMLKPLQEQSSQAASLENDPRIILDYARMKDGQWMQDGHTFGLGPVRPGQIRISGDPNHPAIGVYPFGAARRDPMWNGLKFAPETQKGQDSIKWDQAGRTIRSPSFTVGDSGRVHFLIQGAGNIYAAVASHRMITGPLHGSLVRGFNTGGKLQWVAHDLGRYKGMRAHLEITPNDGGEFLLLAVAHEPLPIAHQQPILGALDEILADAPGSVSDLAKAYQARFDGIRKQFIADGHVAGEPEAKIVEWLIQNDTLGGGADDAATKATDLARLLLEAETKLAETIQRTSRIAPAMWEGDAENERLLVRGNWKNEGPEVPRRLLEALDGKQHPAPAFGSGRLELARQMTDPKQNPYVPRVLVNRVWHHLFGRGIVASVDNFGVLGTRPSHPQLLDHLASRLVAEGWSVKKLIRSIMLSRTYQMSSKPLNSNAETIDPTNILLHRQRVRRLQGEAIRDSILALSGRLDPKMHGPSVRTHLTKFTVGRGRPGGSGPMDGAGRRSVYLEIRRNFISPFMLAFDTPIPFNTIGRRNVSNVPSQALILMNDPFVIEQAKLWARRSLKDTTMSPEQRIAAFYEEAFAREVTDSESQAAVAFLKRQSTAYGIAGDAWQTDERPWSDLCHVLWNVKEFTFIN